MIFQRSSYVASSFAVVYRTQHFAVIAPHPTATHQNSYKLMSCIPASPCGTLASPSINTFSVAYMQAFGSNIDWNNKLSSWIALISLIALPLIMHIAE